MDTFEALFNRRSIRQYTQQAVPDELVQTLLKAAMYAPSASNGQPWHFVVIRDRSTLDAIPSFHPHAAMVPQAQLAILVCGKVNPAIPAYWLVDCAAATENLLLAAHASGLGAVWLGVAPRTERMEGMRKLIPLPEGIEPFALIPIGYPAEIKEQPDRFLPERIHNEHW
jgi:nitroreductase